MYTTNKRGFVYILRATSDLHTRSLAQRTQILWTPDISQVLFRLEIRPGMRICESGTGSGSLSTSFARGCMPTGHLFTFEFNEDRVGKAKSEFAEMGLSKFITVTHRDVLANGFLLEAQNEEDSVKEDSIDCVFLDLPSPQIAVEHANKVLRKQGKLCNFSPCIEQVQKATTMMAKLGFYNIKTIECLSRETIVRAAQFTSINPKKDGEMQTDMDFAEKRAGEI